MRKIYIKKKSDKKCISVKNKTSEKCNGTYVSVSRLVVLNLLVIIKLDEQKIIIIHNVMYS